MFVQNWTYAGNIKEKRALFKTNCAENKIKWDISNFALSVDYFLRPVYIIL